MSVTDSSTIKGRIDVKTYDVEKLRDSFGDWDELSKRERYLLTQDPDRIDFSRLDCEWEETLAHQSVDPDTVTTDYNTTCTGLHTYIVDEFDPGVTVDETASHLALGNDSSVTPSSTDTSLNNEVYREVVTDHANNGNELLTSTFIDSNEANGYSLEEVGLFTASSGGKLLNHSLITAITKDNSKTVTIDVTLTFSAA